MTSGDAVFLGGTVVTMDGARIAEAVAVRGDRILAVGATRDVLGSLAPDTNVLDLAGRSLIPGLVDNHIHMTNAWQRAWVDCSYPTRRSVGEITEAMAAAAAGRPAGSWVIGRGFEPARLAEGRSPNRHDLDRLLPDHRVGICNREGMGWTFNSLALRSLGVRDDTPDPPGGSLERDAAGAPLGPMWDTARAVFVSPNLPGPSDEDIVEGYAWIERQLLSYGITTAHEAGYKEARHARGWVALRQRQPPALRVVLGPYPLGGASWDEDGAPGRLVATGLSTGFGDGWLRLGALQMGVDGGLIGGTAALLEPYANRSDRYRGSYRVSQEVLDAAVRRADEGGWDAGLICQGEGGIERSLAAVRALGRDRRRGHRLEHAYLWTPRLMDEMAELGVAWNTQPALLPLTGPYLRSMLGDRARWAFPFRSLLERGVAISGGSDWGVGPIDPFVGIDALVNHRADVEPDAGAFVPGERLSLLDALRIYTLGGAQVAGQEERAGSIEAGKLADLVVLDRDVTALPDGAIRELRVDQTWVGGRLVYERS